MRRRDFITLLGGAAAWPLTARAQQPTVQVVGYLGLVTPEAQAGTVAGFRKGLGETGYVEGRNVAIEFLWAESQFDRFPALAADLVRRRVAVIFTSSPSAVRAAMAASATTPVVFIMGEDPVKEGLVPSLNRPAGNVTGISDFANQLAGKLLGLLHDTVPKATVFALLVNPAHPNVESDTKDAQVAAAALGLELRVLRAGTERDFETAFAAMVQFRVGALFVNTDPFFDERHEQLIALAARHAIPAIYARRQFPAAGGLMSYEADRLETSRLAGIYVGRILKGEKPGNLPVQQATKFTFIINLKTAKALGLEIPPTVLALADEVIE
jgi:putative tryptophan/tyrosine transport system substrate-binding protein